MKGKTYYVLVNSILFNAFFAFCVSKDDLKETSIFEELTCTPVETKNYLSKNNNVYNIYKLGMTFKKQYKLRHKDKEILFYSIKCFEFIIDKYHTKIPVCNTKLREILGKSYCQVGKFNYKTNSREHAFVNFLIAKDLGVDVSKYIKKINTEDLLKIIYKTGSLFYNKKESLDPKITHKNFDIARKCFEYVIAKYNSVVDTLTDDWEDYKRLNRKNLTKSYYQLGMLEYKLGNYHFAEKNFKLAIVSGSDIAKQFIMSDKWIEKKAFPYFKSCY